MVVAEEILAESILAALQVVGRLARDYGGVLSTATVRYSLQAQAGPMIRLDAPAENGFAA